MQQKALSLMQFQKKFGTEKACQKHLFRLRWPEGFRCPRCQHDQAYFQRSRNLYHCRACGYQASLTAGTVFHKTRTPLHKWFWMIWLMGRQKSGISMLSLQRMLESQLQPPKGGGLERGHLKAAQGAKVKSPSWERSSRS